MQWRPNLAAAFETPIQATGLPELAVCCPIVRSEAAIRRGYLQINRERRSDRPS
jgi:hypothetical protein